MEFEKKGDRGCRHNGSRSVWKNIEHLKMFHAFMEEWKT